MEAGMGACKANASAAWLCALAPSPETEDNGYLPGPLRELDELFCDSSYTSAFDSYFQYSPVLSSFTLKVWSLTASRCMKLIGD